MREPESASEDCLPYLGNELWSTVKDNVSWDPMELDNVVDQEVCTFQGCGEFG